MNGDIGTLELEHLVMRFYVVFSDVDLILHLVSSLSWQQICRSANNLLLKPGLN